MARTERSMAERFLDSGALHPERERHELPPAVRMFGRGLLRFLAVTASAATVAAGLGAAFGGLSGGSIVRWVAIGLYVGAALLVFFAVFSFSNAPRHWVGPVGEDLGTSGGGDLGAFVAVGLTLVGLGILVDSFA
jgi:hypothetical protein